eukprot:9475737-Pyramimonas_sp.AAC.1
MRGLRLIFPHTIFPTGLRPVAYLGKDKIKPTRSLRSLAGSVTCKGQQAAPGRLAGRPRPQ